MENFRNFVQYYTKLSDEEFDQMLSVLQQRRVKKNAHILRNGQICQELIYINQGCFRVYKKLEKKEINIWFSFEDMIVSELYSFIRQTPTQLYVQAMEDAEIITLPYHDLQRLYRQSVGWQEFGRKLMEEIVTGVLDRVITFQFDSAEERYRKLLQSQDHLQRIPLKHLASYLGVRDTSLSRIRRQIT